MNPDPSRNPAVAPNAEALATVESLQAQLASLRQSISDPTAKLSIGERAAAAHHVQVIAGSLGVLHSAFRRIASDDRANHAIV